MNRFFMALGALVLLGSAPRLRAAALSPAQIQQLPPAAIHQIDFVKEIKPLFESSCIKCHGRGRAKGEFSIENRETVLRGGETGPALVPGKSAESYMIELVAGINPDEMMPKKGKRLTPGQVGLLRAWIDQGAPWDASISFARPQPVNLFPRKPELPAANNAVKNPIDRLLLPYFGTRGIKPAKPVTDRVYARRLYLDAIGLLPAPEELAQFLADQRPGKRDQWVKRLLADNRRYAEHWLTFWNDALRNDYRGTGYIDGGRKQITAWLYSALAENMPFDEFVRELIDPGPESEGFVKGIVWRGVVNASQTPQMQAAQNISQVFMGVNLKCASCHDSLINDWTLADAYGLASIYSESPLELVQCDKPTGHFAATKFIYPELGSINPQAPRAERLKQLAGLITSRRDARLTRTIVNRLWARFFGRGLIEPTHDMDNPAWNQDLLDWLAADLAENGYNLKRTIELILTSQAYQLPAVPLAEEGAGEFVFRGPLLRRLSSEQFLDALAGVTGVWFDAPAAQIDFSRADPQLAKLAVEPKWIWNDPGAAAKAEAATLYWRKEIDLPDTPAGAAAVVACDNSFKLFVNGKEAGSGNDYTQPRLINLKPHLVKGRNLIAIEAVNGPAKPDDKSADQSNPAGLILYARIRYDQTNAKLSGTIMDFATDQTWLWSTNKAGGWQKPEFVASDWKAAAELGNLNMAPWQAGRKFTSVIAAAALRGKTRAALVNSDPLMTALGRPNREQVVTSRSSAATTLQALELTNGATLAGLLGRGAEQIVHDLPQSSHELAISLYERALARKPTKEELRLAEEMVGSPAQKAGVEDLLWAMTMLPEFQLIY
jgi:hypothetical protein